jgi:hypothetical protein
MGAGRPSLAVVEREGDSRGAIAVAVTTEGIASDRGAMVAVALAALVEERLSARGVDGASPAPPGRGRDLERASPAPPGRGPHLDELGVIGGWDGWRLRALVASPGDAAELVDAVREAMITPIAPKDHALAAIARKVGALARRPLPDRALIDVARCTGEAYAAGEQAPPSEEELETWRRAAHGLGRVAIAATGEPSLVDAVAAVLARGPAWPNGASLVPSQWPPADAQAVIYDASGELAPGAARVLLTVRTTSPERAVAAASALGDPRGPLASRLAGLDAPAHLRSVVATAHVDGGCVAATVDLFARDLSADAPARVAIAAALARQELAVEIGDVAAPPDLRRALVTRPSDPRDAAERAAWWALAGKRPGPDEARTAMVVGLASTRDAFEAPSRAPDASSGYGMKGMPWLAEAVRAEIDRATIAWHAPVLEARTRVERGQGESWVLLASTCGTLPEGSHDAGTGATVATAAAMKATEAVVDCRVEPFVAADGIGVLAHGPARAGESPQAHARRLADVAGRAFAADALDAARVTRARAALLARAAEPEARALGALGMALAAGHPAWVDPLGTTFGLGSASDDAVAIRAAAIRAGPLRVAVLSNSDAAQANAAVSAVDRWVARRPNESRACPPLPTPATTHAKTYAVDLPPGAPSLALLALPLVPGDQAGRTAATWIAAAIDGPGGLLARAVGGSTEVNPPEVSSARGWSAAVVGAPRSPALVVRLVAADTTLDTAVAKVRALLERLRQGELREEDRARASAALARLVVSASLDPRARVIDLWRGEASTVAPSLDTLRAFASATLRDDALLIVAERPPAGRETRGTGRESSRE